jgi:hypothetical protein
VVEVVVCVNEVVVKDTASKASHAQASSDEDARYSDQGSSARADIATASARVMHVEQRA